MQGGALAVLPLLELADKMLCTGDQRLPRALEVLVLSSVELLEMVGGTGRAQMMQAAFNFCGTAITYAATPSSRRLGAPLRRQHSDQGLFTNLLEVCCPSR